MYYFCIILKFELSDTAKFLINSGVETLILGFIFIIASITKNIKGNKVSSIILLIYNLSLTQQNLIRENKDKTNNLYNKIYQIMKEHFKSNVIVEKEKISNVKSKILDEKKTIKNLIETNQKIINLIDKLESQFLINYKNKTIKLEEIRKEKKEESLAYKNCISSYNENMIKEKVIDNLNDILEQSEVLFTFTEKIEDYKCYASPQLFYISLILMDKLFGSNIMRELSPEIDKKDFETIFSNIVNKSLVSNKEQANFIINKDYYNKILKILNSLKDYGGKVPALEGSITKIINDILNNIPIEYYSELLEIEEIK